MAINQILPFGTAAGANVLSPAEYQALASRVAGFQSGVAKSKELNTAWRQSSFVVSMLAQYIADKSGQDVLDNGDIAALQAKFVAALATGQRGLSALGVKVVQTSQTLAIADLGFTVILNALSGSLVVTLPAAALTLRGSRFEFVNNGAIGASIVKQGADNVLNTDGSLAAAGASVPVGAFLTLECVDSATWVIVNASPASASTSTAGVLRVSSTLQAQQMTDDGVAITPKKLKDAFLGANQQLTTLGFQKMPGGTIEQWLRVPHTLGMGVPQSYTFPFAFPNATLGVSIVDISAPNSGAVVWAASQITASGLSMFWNYSNVTGGTSSREVFIRAIGW